MSDVVFLGPPGAGKGTQAVRVAAALHVPHISTGDMLRAAVASGSELGRTVKGILEAGHLVSDDVMAGVVRERLGQPDCAGGFLLDGYPRTLPQCAFLDGILGDAGRALHHVVLFEVPDAELVERLLKRGRTDDTRQTVERRLQVYAAETAPLKNAYAARGLLRTIDGTGAPDAVFARVLAAVGAAG